MSGYEACAVEVPVTQTTCTFSCQGRGPHTWTGRCLRGAPQEPSSCREVRSGPEQLGAPALGRAGLGAGALVSCAAWLTDAAARLTEEPGLGLEV